MVSDELTNRDIIFVDSLSTLMVELPILNRKLSDYFIVRFKSDYF